MERKIVFLTGATGNMGWAGFQELHERADRVVVRVLARPSKKNRKNPSEELMRQVAEEIR